MASVRLALHRRSAIAALLAAGMAIGFGSVADARPAHMRDALGLDRMDEGRQSATPQIARYVIDEGGSFILDRTQSLALLKFDDSSEVWVLVAVRGPRGDMIYKNDVGEPMLRFTRLGGMTVFTPKRPTGAAAALVGSAISLKPGVIGPLELYRRLYQSSVRISRAVQHTVIVEAPDTGPGSDVLIADAAVVTTEVFVALASQPGTRPLVAPISRIQFIEGPRAGVSLQSGVLTITVSPTAGLAGRPSSRRIIKAAWGR
jgi:hypothetical protein